MTQDKRLLKNPSAANIRSIIRGSPDSFFLLILHREDEGANVFGFICGHMLHGDPVMTWLGEESGEEIYDDMFIKAINSSDHAAGVICKARLEPLFMAAASVVEAILPEGEGIKTAAMWLTDAGFQEQINAKLEAMDRQSAADGAVIH
jgi:hypothetical protein